MFVHRCDKHHLIRVERRQLQHLLVYPHADQPHVEGAAHQAIHDALTVALKDMELGCGANGSEGGQNLRQDIGGGDGGRSDADHFFVLVAPAAHQIVPQIYNVAGAFVQLLSSGCDLHRFRGAHDKTGLKFLLQLPHMGADGGLGQI